MKRLICIGIVISIMLIQFSCFTIEAKVTDEDNIIGYYADVYFDGKKVETYYPESYKVNASTKGIELDIKGKYWIEGAIGWPIAIIYL